MCFTCSLWIWEESISFVFLSRIFTFELFIGKKHDLSKKKIRLSRAVVRKFVSRLQPPPQKLESWNFGSRRILAQIVALHTQNFDELFFRVAAIQMLGFQRIFHAHKILHASLQHVVCKKLNLIEVKQYEGSLLAPYQLQIFFLEIRSSYVLVKATSWSFSPYLHWISLGFLIAGCCPVLENWEFIKTTTKNNKDE
jgi:hypothetical protein